MANESPAELITSEKVVEVGQGSTSPVHIPESVIDEMACKEPCARNPDQEVRPPLAMISEEWMWTSTVPLPTVNPVDSRPAFFQELKTYVDAETQTEPVVCSPVVEVLTPRKKRKLVEKDHVYCKKKLELQPVQPKTSFKPKANTTDDAIRESDSSDDDWDVDFDDAGTDYDSDTSDEDWEPDEGEVDSDDENPINYPTSEINWLKETDRFPSVPVPFTFRTLQPLTGANDSRKDAVHVILAIHLA